MLDKNGYAGAVIMNLSKASDIINHDLLIAKLNVYGFTKNSSFSSWTELLLGLPQGSVIGTLLSNICVNDLFFLTESTKYAIMQMVPHFMFVTSI